MNIPPELIAAKELAQWSILALPGVVGVGIGMREVNGELFDEVAIRVLVSDISSIPAGIPETVGGTVVSIVESVIEPLACQQDDSRYNPIVGGIKIEKPTKGFGTLGAVVQDSSTGELLGLSNFHVVGNPNANFPDTIWQPSAPPLIAGMHISPADNIGHVIRIDFPQTPPFPFSPNLISLADAAIFTLVSALEQGRTLVSNIAGQGASTILINRINTTDNPTVGTFVRKRGFATQLTEGVIVGAFLTHQWTAGPPNCYLIEQAEIRGLSSSNSCGDVFALKGDSGSVVLKKGSDTAVGLLWGGSSTGKTAIMSSINNVQSQLGINIVWI
jgi:hypothetical protein